MWRALPRPRPRRRRLQLPLRRAPQPQPACTDAEALAFARSKDSVERVDERWSLASEISSAFSSDDSAPVFVDPAAQPRVQAMISKTAPTREERIAKERCQICYS